MARPLAFGLAAAPTVACAARPSEIRVPELDSAARTGKAVFDENCAVRHGPSGAGADQGPPLGHGICAPGHRRDFGDMRPIEGVADTEIGSIVPCVRDLRRANGIE